MVLWGMQNTCSGSFGSPPVPSTMNTGIFSVLLMFLYRLICSGLDHWLLWMFFRIGFLIGICLYCELLCGAFVFSDNLGFGFCDYSP